MLPTRIWCTCHHRFVEPRKLWNQTVLATQVGFSLKHAIETLRLTLMLCIPYKNEAKQMLCMFNLWFTIQSWTFYCLQNSDRITIVVHHLSLTDGSAILQDDNVQMLFVEYKFLECSPEELETPFALPKPKPGQRISFHFTKGTYCLSSFQGQRPFYEHLIY